MCFECELLRESVRRDGSIFKLCMNYGKPVTNRLIERCLLESQDEYYLCLKCGLILHEEGVCLCGGETITISAEDAVKVFHGEKSIEDFVRG